MATNNTIDRNEPVPSWFIYLDTTLNNVIGGSSTYLLPFDTTLYVTGGVTYASPEITIPKTGYYLLNAGYNVSNIDATHTTLSLSVWAPIQTIHMNDSATVVSSSGITSYSSSEVVHLTAADKVYYSIFVDGTQTVSCVGGSAPNYVTWSAGRYLFS